MRPTRSALLLLASLTVLLTCSFMAATADVRGPRFVERQSGIAPEARLQTSVPLIDVAPLDFACLGASEVPQNVQFVVSNIGDADLFFDVQVTSDGGGLAHVLVEGGSDYSGAIAASGAADALTVTYDGIGLLVGAEHTWRLEVTSNDPANNPSVGGTPIDVTLHVRVAAPLCPVALTGDVNMDGALGAVDVIFMVNFVFKGGAVPQPCVWAGDNNCNGSVTSADIIVLVNHLFKGGVAPCDVCTMIPCPSKC